MEDTESGTPPEETLTNAPPPLCGGSVGRTEPAVGVNCGGIPCGPAGVRSGEASKGATADGVAGFVDNRDVARVNVGSVSGGGPNRRTPGLTKLQKENYVSLNIFNIIEAKHTFSLDIRSCWCLDNTSADVYQR